MNHDSRHLAQEIDDLKQHLLMVAGLVENRLRLALRGLVDQSPLLLADVIAGDVRINNLHVEIDDHCFRLAALRQPVAVDLRTVLSILRINADLERVGQLTISVGEAAQQYLLQTRVKPQVDLSRMGDLALRMLRQAVDAFVSRDINRAHAVLEQDIWLDALRDQIFRVRLTYMLGDPATIEPGIHLILISRCLERVGDHTTNIAEDVIFALEGRDVRNRSLLAAVERRRSVGGPPI